MDSFDSKILEDGRRGKKTFSSIIFTGGMKGLHPFQLNTSTSQSFRGLWQKKKADFQKGGFVSKRKTIEIVHFREGKLITYTQPVRDNANARATAHRALIELALNDKALQGRGS